MSKTLDLSALSKIAASVFTNNPSVYVTDCTSRGNREAYSADATWFIANPTRRLSVRYAHWLEFDSFDTVQDFMQVPLQFALVTQLSPGIHKCELVYIGRKHQAVMCKSDADVAQLLLRMQSEQGHDEQDLLEFLNVLDANSRDKHMATNGKNVN